MESEFEPKEKFQPITESVTDWESGNAETPVARMDYSRASHNHALVDSGESEANSDLGNLGRDVEDFEPAQSVHSR